MTEKLLPPLPTKDGVNSSSVVLPPGPWNTIFEFLKSRFPEIDATAWIVRMEKGEVVDQNGVRLLPESPCRSGLKIYYYRELERETPVPFKESILYQDDHLLAVDKPHFLPVVPSGRFLQETLLVRLKRKLKLDNLVPVHRIDRETAGIVLFSVRPESRGDYSSLFRGREVLKTYEAVAPMLRNKTFPVAYRSRLVEGDPFFRMKESEGEPNSETRIELLENRGEIALYRLTPVTGRKHQLRVHLASLGIPILNDGFYPQPLPENSGDFSRPLQLLARAIAFTDPLTGEPRRFESRRALSFWS